MYIHTYTHEYKYTEPFIVVVTLGNVCSVINHDHTILHDLSSCSISAFPVILAGWYMLVPFFDQDFFFCGNRRLKWASTLKSDRA